MRVRVRHLRLRLRRLRRLGRGRRLGGEHRRDALGRRRLLGSRRLGGGRLCGGRLGRGLLLLLSLTRLACRAEDVRGCHRLGRRLGRAWAVGRRLRLLPAALAQHCLPALDGAPPVVNQAVGLAPELCVQATVLLVVEAPHRLARARFGRVDAVHVARHRLEGLLGFIELGGLDELVLHPVVALDAARQQVDGVQAVVGVDILLQSGLGLLRRHAVLLRVPAEGHQLVARQRLGQLRVSHGSGCVAPAAGARRQNSVSPARERGVKAGRSG